MKKIIIFFYFVLLTSSVFAQDIKFYVSSGIAKLPMKEWENFMNETSPSKFSSDKFSINHSFEIEYEIISNHSIIIDISQINYKIDYYSVIFWGTFDDTTDYSFDNITYKFRSYPIHLGYKFSPNFKIPMYFKGKIGYYFSEVKSQLHPIFDRTGVLSQLSQKGKREGKGYGIEFGIGLDQQLTKHLLFATEISYRYANGMGFTDESKSVKVEFTGLYFTLKIGWQF